MVKQILSQYDFGLSLSQITAAFKQFTKTTNDCHYQRTVYVFKRKWTSIEREVEDSVKMNDFQRVRRLVEMRKEAKKCLSSFFMQMVGKKT